MRIRIIKPFYYQRHNRRLVPGDVVNVREEDARLWLRHEMAMQDKSLDGATETKDNPGAKQKSRKSRR